MICSNPFYGHTHGVSTGGCQRDIWHRPGYEGLGADVRPEAHDGYSSPIPLIANNTGRFAPGYPMGDFGGYIKAFYLTGIQCGKEIAGNIQAAFGDQTGDYYGQFLAEKQANILGQIHTGCNPAVLESELLAADDTYLLDELAKYLIILIDDGGLDGLSAGVDSKGNPQNYGDVIDKLRAAQSDAEVARLVAETIQSLHGTLSGGQANAAGDGITALFDPNNIYGSAKMTGDAYLNKVISDGTHPAQEVLADITAARTDIDNNILNEIRANSVAACAAAPAPFQPATILNALKGDGQDTQLTIDNAYYINSDGDVGDRAQYQASSVADAIQVLLNKREVLKANPTGIAGTPLAAQADVTAELQKTDAVLMTLLAARSMGRLTLHGSRGFVNRKNNTLSTRAGHVHKGLGKALGRIIGQLRHKSKGVQQKLKKAVVGTEGHNLIYDALYNMSFKLYGLGVYNPGVAMANKRALTISYQLAMAGIQKSLISTFQSKGIDLEFHANNPKAAGQQDQQGQQGVGGQVVTKGKGNQLEDATAMALNQAFAILQDQFKHIIDPAIKNADEMLSQYDEVIRGSTASMKEAFQSGLGGQGGGRGRAA